MQDTSFQFFSPLKTPAIKEKKKMAKTEGVKEKNFDKDLKGKKLDNNGNEAHIKSSKGRKTKKKDKHKLEEKIPSSNPASDASDVDVNHDILSLASNISQNLGQSMDSSDVSDMDTSLPFTSTQNNTPFKVPGSSPTKSQKSLSGISPVTSKDSKRKRSRSESESSSVSDSQSLISPKKRVRLSKSKVKEEMVSSDSEKTDTSESENEEKPKKSVHNMSSSDSEVDIQEHNIEQHKASIKSPQKTMRSQKNRSIDYKEKNISESESEDDESNTDDKISQKINLRSDFPKDMAASGFHKNSLWLEDLQKGNKEIWMLRVPLDFDLGDLDGKSALLEGSIFLGNEKNENKRKAALYSWELHAMKNKEKKESSACVLLPSKKTKTLKNAGSLDGQMWISKSLATEPYVIPQSTKQKPQIPSDLKMRNIPFGSDMPLRQKELESRSKIPNGLQDSTSSSASKKSKKHKKEMRYKDETDSSILMEVAPKSQRKEKDRSANDVDTTPKSHKKHKKDKDKRKSRELNTSNFESPVSESAHKSHKKHKDNHIEPTEDNVVVHKKHKKDKKKKKSL